MAQPLVLLGPGRSFTTVAAGMLGQHPEHYGMPELNLTLGETIGEFLRNTGGGRNGLAHGIVRAMAQLEYGEVTAEGVDEMRAFLFNNPGMTTAALMAELQAAVAPKAIVEKSPSIVADPQYPFRQDQILPGANYLHITRHPMSAGRSMMTAEWYAMILASPLGDSWDRRMTPPVLDPQVHWFVAHERIMDFLDTIEPERHMRIRGEDLLTDPDRWLKTICDWVGVSSDAEAIEAMKHPETSPFAQPGPENAPWGGDPSFQEKPALRPYTAKPEPLTGALPWRDDGMPFADHVVEMAKFFGYKDG
ncbi:sulfotransferase family protein [Dinoroseobacter sp. S124A]|uniref:sulfotransferase family protein n=1 Tax=Dinoroseobacter sp. S124A TaxID=3415128 RepID=UPI003C7A7339